MGFSSPLSPGDPGGGPDCHVPKGIEGLGPIPAQPRWETYSFFYIGLKRSWVIGVDDTENASIDDHGGDVHRII